MHFDVQRDQNHSGVTLKYTLLELENTLRYVSKHDEYSENRHVPGVIWAIHHTQFVVTPLWFLTLLKLDDCVALKDLKITYFNWSSYKM